MGSIPFTTGQKLELGGNIIGGLFEALGQKQESDANSLALQQQASILRGNALLADRNAELRLIRGQHEVNARQTQRQQDVGTARASAAGRGVVVDQDTAALVEAQTIANAKRDEILLRDNAHNEALAIRYQGAQLVQQAQYAEKTAKSVSKSGSITAAGTLIGTAGTVAAKWLTFNSDAIKNEKLGTANVRANTHTAGGYI